MPNMTRTGVSMISKLTLIAACIATSASNSVASVTLSRDGKSDYVIVVADEAMAPERKAAEDLADYLKQITGAQLPVTEEAKIVGTPHFVSVGRTKLAEK